MNKLKDLRTQLRLTQKQVAERLNTTQQTIQRWESGRTEIPAGHLKDLAVFFGCSVDELLGVDAKKRRDEDFARAQHEKPWGTLRVRFAFGEREYPIDHPVRDELLDEFHYLFGVAQPRRLVEFIALDNRLVFLNTALVQEVEIVTDDQEAMPFFASPEAYQALTKDGPPSNAGPVLREECTKILMHLGVGTDFVRATEKLNSLEYISGDGRSVTTYLSDQVATSIETLKDRHEIETNTFVTVAAEHWNHRCVNLAAIAAIEVPTEAFLAHIAKDTLADH